MNEVLSVTLPIFLLIVLGYVATVRGLTTRDNIRGIGMFVIRFALPALIFRALSQRSISEIMNVPYLVVYALGSLFSFAILFIFTRYVQKKGVASGAMAGLGVSASNTGFVGFPIAAMVVGPDAIVALSLTMIIENLVILPLALGLAESESRKEEPLHKILFYVVRRLTRNPMVLGILAGAAASIAGWHPPAPLFRAIDLLANASSAAALFAVGGALAGMSWKALGFDAVRIAAAKLFIHPMAVFSALMLFPAIAQPYKTSMIIFAAAPMLSIYSIVAQPYGGEREAAAALLGATFFSFFTISALLLVL